MRWFNHEHAHIAPVSLGAGFRALRCIDSARVVLRGLDSVESSRVGETVSGEKTITRSNDSRGPWLIEHYASSKFKIGND